MESIFCIDVPNTVNELLLMCIPFLHATGLLSGTGANEFFHVNLVDNGEK